MTLLELTIASSLMAVLVTTVAVVLRGAHTAWLAVEADHAQLDSAQAALRHIVRAIRQAQSVSAISAASDVSGSLNVVLASGSAYTWDHDAPSQCINSGPTGGLALLADNITELSFTGYKADGVTTTTVPADIQAVKCQAKVVLPRETGGTRIVSSWAWLRTW